MGSQSWEDDGIVVRPFKYIRLFGKINAFLLLPRYKKRILRYCQQHGIPQLVHAHFALPDGYIAYQISQLFNAPYIISFRKSDIASLNLPPHCSTKKLMSEVLSNASKIIVHNAAQQETLSEAGYESIVMPHGIEANFFAKKESANTSNILNIACVGELIVWPTSPKTCSTTPAPAISTSRWVAIRAPNYVVTKTSSRNTLVASSTNSEAPRPRRI